MGAKVIIFERNTKYIWIFFVFWMKIINFVA